MSQSRYQCCEKKYGQLYQYCEPYSLYAMTSATKFILPHAPIYNKLSGSMEYRNPDSRAIDLTYLYGDQPDEQIAAYRYDEFNLDRGDEMITPGGYYQPRLSPQLNFDQAMPANRRWQNRSRRQGMSSGGCATCNKH